MAEVAASAAVQGTTTATQKKGVATQHPEYIRMLPKWTRCRDVCKGQDAIHEAGEKYLPKLIDQKQPDYDAYVKRAGFYNATWRTVSGLNGMLFRKAPVVKASEALVEMFKDVTQAGVPLHMFAQKVSEEALKVGRVGVLTDHPPAPAQDITKADAATLNLRPTLALYEAESIINWRQRLIGNKYVLSMVVLVEQHEVPVDEFGGGTVTKYRVLDLFDEKVEGSDTISTKYRVRVFTIGSKGEDLLESTTIPTMNSQALPYIPFVFLGTDDITPEVDDPPLIDLVDVNLSHYRTNADYEHGCHFTGLPTAVVSGYTPVQPDNPNLPVEKLYIGSASAWVFPDPEASATYLEFTGQGLTALKENLDRKEQQMAVLGARMLEPMKKGVEAAETASIHRVGEESMLASVAQAISLGLTQALGWFSEWAGSTSTDTTIALNRDFFPVSMTPQMLQALIAGWQSGAYSKETLFSKLQKGEIVSPDTDFETEETRIENAPPVMPGGGAPASEPGDQGAA